MSKERIVFDTEPLVAHLASETGAGVVEEYLDRVDEDDAEGYISPVTLTEVRYITERNANEPPDVFLNWLQTITNQVSASECWENAARHKTEHQVALGDAYSLAAAKEVGATLLVGADDDFDEITDVEVERFREDAA